MTYTDINLANERIVELEALLEAEKEKNRHPRVVPNMIIGDVALLDEVFECLGGVTLREFLVNDGAEIIYSKDGKYFRARVNLEDIFNETHVKDEAKALGYELGGEDFTRTESKLLWIISYRLWKEFKKVSPFFKSDVEI